MEKLFIIYGDKSQSINEIKEGLISSNYEYIMLSLNNIFGYDLKTFIIDYNVFERTLKQIVYYDGMYITRDEKLFLKKLEKLNRKNEIGNG